MSYCKRCKEVFDEDVCPFCGNEPTEINEDRGHTRCPNLIHDCGRY
jgi:rRNA maturation endonuclease Nob1